MTNKAESVFQMPSYIMNTTLTVPLTASLLFSAGSTFAEHGIAIPYNSVNSQMKVLKNQNIEGVDCPPWYVKGQRNDRTLDTTNP